MALYEFIDNDSQYVAWLEINTEGFVLTTKRQRPTNYMALHYANCRLISKYNNMAKPDGFTERG